jgi:hypothetical protein
MKTGSTARLIQPEIKGQVLKRQVNNDEVECLLEYEQGGETHRKWVPEALLEEVAQ